jgi:hypothetical protein
VAAPVAAAVVFFFLVWRAVAAILIHIAFYRLSLGNHRRCPKDNFALPHMVVAVSGLVVAAAGKLAGSELCSVPRSYRILYLYILAFLSSSSLAPLLAASVVASLSLLLSSSSLATLLVAPVVAVGRILLLLSSSSLATLLAAPVVAMAVVAVLAVVVVAVAVAVVAGLGFPRLGILDPQRRGQKKPYQSQPKPNLTETESSVGRHTFSVYDQPNYSVGIQKGSVGLQKVGCI